VEHWSDFQLLQQTPGAPAAFDVFYRRHERLVLAYLMRRTANPELAADLCAETFAAALLAAGRFGLTVEGDLAKLTYRNPDGSTGSVKLK
jgi:DNA-directed RNA polymerase specialized sigma24 family protein